MRIHTLAIVTFLLFLVSVPMYAAAENAAIEHTGTQYTNIPTH